MIKFKTETFIFSLFLLFILFFSNVHISAQERSSNTVFLKESVEFLASDSLKGRFPGTVEDSLAAYYIAAKMEEIGLVPLIGDSFVIPFNLTLYRHSMSDSYVKINNRELIVDKDYSISPLSPTLHLKGQISLDTSIAYAKDKIILIRSPKDSINFKITPLIEKGFSAVLFYDETSFVPYTNLKGSQSAIPIIMISTKYANYLTKNTSLLCEINSNTQPVLARTYNIAGVTPSKKGKYIMAGAHYDHLGMGGKDSGSMEPDSNKIHPGADDNASGVSAILEIGRLLNLDLNEINNQKSYGYDIAISAFGAEERGLVGSSILADSLMKLNRLPTLMINLDMVGRLKDNKLQAGGAGTFHGADSLLAESNKRDGFDLIITREGMGPSDHSSFYSKKVPVLYFTTGVHKQYHTSADNISFINFEGLKSVIDYVVSIVKSVNSSSFTPLYNYVEQQVSSHDKSNLKVTLGLIPDFTYEKGDGFKIGPVAQGRPAYNAGLKEGDLIIMIGSKKINNIYDYMASLAYFKKDQKIQIVIIREQTELIKVVNL